MSTVESINAVLQNLESEVPSVSGCVLASRDGFVISNTLNGEEAEEIAAMVATTIGVSSRMASTLSAGEVEETAIQADQRSVFLYLAGEDGVLAVITGEDPNVGMVNLQARRATDQIAEYLTDPSTAAA